MSRALQRLRDTIGDELLVRTPQGYRLTPRAERVLCVMPAPEVIRSMKHQMAWHPRLDGDLGQRWLRDVIRAVAADPPKAGLPDLGC